MAFKPLYPGPDNPKIDQFLESKANAAKHPFKPLYPGPDNPQVDKYLELLKARHDQQITDHLPHPKPPPPKPPPIFPAINPKAGRDPISNLPTAQRNAYTSLQDILGQWGLETLAPKVLDFIKSGYDSTSLTYLLQQTQEYKNRFAANDTRIKNGLAPLTPAEYLSTERSYRDVLRSSGLPTGFYDRHDDFTNMIAADISPTELKARADNAFKFAQNAVDPNVKAQLQQYYGVTDAHLAAYFLDPKQSEAMLDRQVRSAEIGGAAKTAGINIDQQHAESYADLGVTYQQAQTSAGQAGVIKDDVLNAAQRFGTAYSEQDLADASIGGLASAQRKQKQLANDEAGLFAGGAGAIQQLGNNPGGSY